MIRFIKIEGTYINLDQVLYFGKNFVRFATGQRIDIFIPDGKRAILDRLCEEQDDASKEQEARLRRIEARYAGGR